MNTRSDTRTALLLIALSAPIALVAACGDDTAATDTSSSGDGGSGGESGDQNAAPVAVSSGTTVASSSSSGSGPGSTSTGEGASGQGGSGDGGSSTGDGGAGQGGGSGGAGQGGGGVGGGAFACEAEAFGGADSTILDVWDADPAELTPFFLPDVVVTAISLGGCLPDAFCQLFVQQEESFASWDDGAQQAIHVVIAPEVAADFASLTVGDRIDLGGSASRDTSGQRDELRFLIRESDPGCASVVGSADPAPVAVTLDDLTQNAWETTHGPLLVQLEGVSGRPHQPDELFALWETGGPQGGGLEQVTNASPFFLPGGEFTGFTPEEIVDFATVTGVFGQFTPTGSNTKYETIYVRTIDELVPLP